MIFIVSMRPIPRERLLREIAFHREHESAGEPANAPWEDSFDASPPWED